MAGILLKACTTLQSPEDNPPVAPSEVSDPMAPSPLATDESVNEDENETKNTFYCGPPQLSVELHATETSADSVLQPLSLNHPFSGSGIIEERPIALPNQLNGADHPIAVPLPSDAKERVVDVPENRAPNLLFSSMTSAEPPAPKSPDPTIMHETICTPPPESHAFSPTVPAQKPVDAMRGTIQLTFSMEIASLQLTPALEMRDLRLRPSSQLVAMRLVSSEAPQPAFNLGVTFELAKVELDNGAIQCVRLRPSARQKPPAFSSSSFAVEGLDLDPQSGLASVRFAHPNQGGTSLHLTAGFQIATIEFSPSFEIATIVLNATSRNVALQLPGAESNATGKPLAFAIERVELNGSQLGQIQVTQLSSGHL